MFKFIDLIVITRRFVPKQSSMFVLLWLGLSVARADVLPIQSFKTNSGIEVWLVEDRSSPVVSLVLKFEKGTNESPYEPSGILFQRTLLDGAGILSPLEMSRFVKETPSPASLDIGFSKTSLTLQTTKEGIAPTLKLWSRLIEDPQFQNANLDHSKSQAKSIFSHYEEDLELIAFLNLLQEIFPKVPFTFDPQKAIKIVDEITPEELKKKTEQLFLYARPKIVVVGNISKRELTELLDASIGKIRVSRSTSPPTPPKPHWHNQNLLVHKEVPQSVVAFVQPGVNPHHNDYPKYLLLQYVLYTRMFEELREKRGLIYSIHYTELHYKDNDLLIGNFSCERSNAPKVAKFIRSEWERLKDFGITQHELSAALLNYKRDDILSLTSTAAVAKEYATPLAFDLSPDSAKKFLEHVEKVNLEEMNNFIQTAFKPESLSFVLLGSFDQTSPAKGNK